MTTLSPIPSNEDSSTTRPSLPYLPLPPELRNKILSLALTGGHVYLRSSSSPQELSHKPTSVNSNFESTLAVNLLATCRQAYNEGRMMFYSENVFHLPPGRWEEMSNVLTNIKPEHLALIKHIVIRLSLLDLRSSVLRRPDYALPKQYQEIGGPNYISIWLFKLKHTQNIFDKANEVRICLSKDNVFGKQASIMIVPRIAQEFVPRNGQELVIQITQENPKCGLIKNPSAIDTRLFCQESAIYEATNMNIVLALAHRANKIITRKIKQLGWQNFKSWLTPDAIGILEEEARHNHPASDDRYTYWREIDIEMITVDDNREV
ncbi:MAG: hypothetical protein Q9195_004732 [Heterodermia aff. obscurata]